MLRAATASTCSAWYLIGLLLPALAVLRDFIRTQERCGRVLHGDLQLIYRRFGLVRLVYRRLLTLDMFCNVGIVFVTDLPSLREQVLRPLAGESFFNRPQFVEYKQKPKNGPTVLAVSLEALPKFLMNVLQFMCREYATMQLLPSLQRELKKPGAPAVMPLTGAQQLQFSCFQSPRLVQVQMLATPTQPQQFVLALAVCVSHLQQLRGKDHHIGLPGVRLVVGILLCHGENPPYKGAGCHTSCAFFRHFITSRASLQQGTFHPRQLFTPPTVSANPAANSRAA